MINTNSIVKGKKAGTFIILGSRVIDGTNGYQLKTVNPQDHTQMGSGELWLPETAVTEL